MATGDFRDGPKSLFNPTSTGSVGCTGTPFWQWPSMRWPYSPTIPEIPYVPYYPQVAPPPLRAWTCPKCGSVYNETVPGCFGCNNPPTVASPDTNPSVVVGDPPNIKYVGGVPPYTITWTVGFVPGTETVIAGVNTATITPTTNTVEKL